MMYSALARVYDLLAYDFDYKQWADRYEALLKQNNPELMEICDAGCGTGTLAIELSSRGYKLTGIDLSGDMLSVASDKAHKAGRRIGFVKQDMRHISLPHRVDALFSACDGVNYLTRLEGVSSFLLSAKNALKDGGALAFDISSEQKLKRMADEGSFFEETEDCAYIWQNILSDDGLILKMEISFYIKDIDGRYERFHESHRQRLWKESEILELIKQAGFVNVTSENEGERIYFSARKPDII